MGTIVDTSKLIIDNNHEDHTCNKLFVGCVNSQVLS